MTFTFKNWPYVTTAFVLGLLVFYALAIYFINASAKDNNSANVYVGANYAVQGLSLTLVILVAFQLYYNFSYAVYPYAFGTLVALFAVTAVSFYLTWANTDVENNTNTNDILTYAFDGAAALFVIMLCITLIASYQSSVGT